METNNSKPKTYHEALLCFFDAYFSKDAKNSYSKLADNELFRSTHMKKKNYNGDETEKKRISRRRAKQWLSDIRSQKRVPKLTLDDLQIAHEISEYPVDALLREKEYWNDKIDYFNDVLLEYINEHQKKIGFSTGMYYPISYHPKSCTMLAAIWMDKSKKRKLSLETTLSLKFSHNPIQYVVLKLSDITYHVYTAYNFDNPSVYKPKLIQSLEEARSEYNKECKCSDYMAFERNFKANISDVFKRLKLFLKKRTSFTEIVRYQKLFYGYYPELLDSDEMKHERKKWTLDDQTNLLKFPPKDKKKKEKEYEYSN